MENIDIQHRNHFMNLFSVAIADNNIHPSELAYLYELGLTRGLSSDQIDNIITNPHKARFIKPTSILGAIEQLYDIVQMVLQDGVIHTHEVNLCKTFAKRFGIQHDIIDALIERLIDEVRANVTKEKTRRFIEE